MVRRRSGGAGRRRRPRGGRCSPSSSTTSSPARRSPGSTPTPRRRSTASAPTRRRASRDAARRAGAARARRSPTRPTRRSTAWSCSTSRRRRSPASTAAQRLADGSIAVRVRGAGARRRRRSSRTDVDDRVVVTEHVDDQLAPRRALGPRRQPRARSSTSRTARELLPPGTLGAVLELAPDHPVEYDAWDLESWTRAPRRAARPAADVDGRAHRRAARSSAASRVRRTFGPSTSTRHLRAARRQRAARRRTSTSTGTTTSTCCRWRSRSTCAPTTRACDIQFGIVAAPDPSVEPVGRGQVRGLRPPLRRRRRAAFGVAVLNDGRYGHGVFDGARPRVSLARAAKYPDPTPTTAATQVTLAVLPHGAGLHDVRAAADALNAPLRVVGGRRRGRRRRRHAVAGRAAIGATRPGSRSTP